MHQIPVVGHPLEDLGQTCAADTRLAGHLNGYTVFLELVRDRFAGPNLEGQSLFPLVRGENAPSRTAYAEQLNALDLNAKMVAKRPQAAFLHVVMNDEWKLIHRPNFPDELYHIESDPHETRNLAGQGHAIEQELMTDLQKRPSALRQEPFAATDDGEAPDMEALKALGYIGDEDESTVDDGN